MENQNNYELVPVLGITLDAVSVPRAVEISQGYVNNDYFNFILLAGAQLALESQESEETQKFVKNADLVLPGDHNIEKAIAMNNEGHYLEDYLDSMLSYMAKNKKKVCVLCENEELCQKARTYLEYDYAGMIVRTVVYDKSGEEAMEAMVNKINGFFPDMVLPVVPLAKQKKLLLDHIETLGTNLYISSERLSTQLFMDVADEKDESTIVKWIKKRLKLGSEGISTEFWQKFDEDVTE